MAKPREVSNPIAGGAFLALASAILFGFTTPLIQRWGVGLGVFGTAALLYLGAALGTLFGAGRPGAEPRIGSGSWTRLVVVAVVGAAIAPSLLVFGLSRTPALGASLLLNLEAPLTLLGAWLLYREHLGGRVLAAASLMGVAGALLALEAARSGGSSSLLGTLAVAGAVTAWAADNALTRPLADLDPVRVVRGKAAIGAAITGLVAVVRGEPAPGGTALAALLLLGASGYGASLRLYLLAQRRIGAARTASLFAVAPFVGAALAYALGDRALGAPGLAAALLFAIGAYLHLSERHAHAHAHPAIEHEHAHRHDDGHHDHGHDSYPAGSHSHPHRHSETRHSHPHADDLHHRHH